MAILVYVTICLHTRLSVDEVTTTRSKFIGVDVGVARKGRGWKHVVASRPHRVEPGDFVVKGGYHG